MSPAFLLQLIVIREVPAREGGVAEAVLWPLLNRLAMITTTTWKIRGSSYEIPLLEDLPRDTDIRSEPGTGRDVHISRVEETTKQLLVRLDQELKAVESDVM